MPYPISNAYLTSPQYLSLQKLLYAGATPSSPGPQRLRGEEYEPITKLREDEEEAGELQFLGFIFVLFSHADEDALKDAECDDPAAPKGIPTFWLTALRNHPGLAEVITERDAEALASLKDVTLEYLEKEGGSYAAEPGFIITFHWDTAANPFFKRGGDFTYNRAVGSRIAWKEEQDLTRVWEIKKQRNKNTNRARIIHKSHPAQSFFNFSSPLVMPNEEVSAEPLGAAVEVMEVVRELAHDLQDGGEHGIPYTGGGQGCIAEESQSARVGQNARVHYPLHMDDVTAAPAILSRRCPLHLHEGCMKDDITRKHMINKVKEGLQAIHDIQMAFESVYGLLAKVDAQRFTGSDSNVIQEFASTWRGYSDAFTASLRQTETLAAKGKAAIDTFVNTIVPILHSTSMSVDDKKKRLDFFITNMDQNGQNDQDIDALP
ncbi:hypothetical protein B0H16DRAFT_1822291 [Mycena metata]|uniref:Uncharacterized protein n=1 Tax=Mycena metata TaxID=1033252 RepID=A0AAD7H0I3_9AGAR|nr:hypothetical protein B0H16DRAFT_1822291 [Mycena metata]